MNKIEVIQAIRKFLVEKRDFLQADIDGISADMANDTKSSAGDKFETSREMSQQEQEKLKIQLAENRKFENLLTSIQSDNKPCTSVQAGSLFHCELGWFFIGLPLGSIEHFSNTLYCIGAASPLAQAFLGKSNGEQILWQGKTLRIDQLS